MHEQKAPKTRPRPGPHPQGRAFDWVFQHGGLARMEDYPYRGINDFCKTDVQEIKFEGEAPAQSLLDCLDVKTISLSRAAVFM